MAATAAATETERELDRVWKALDDATGRIDALERGRGLQLAPAPDYRTSEPGPIQVEETPRCMACGRPLARFAGPEAGDGGWTCVVCGDEMPDPEPVEACSCEEAVALRKDVEHYRSLWDESRALVERLVAERDAARSRVDELAEARAEALSQRNAFASEVAALRRLAP